MLEFKSTDTSVALIVTLTELTDLADANYLFEFIHVQTKNVVAFVKLAADDESTHPERYNQYTINPSLVFAGEPTGEWHYRIFEQLSTTNVDPDLSGNIVEEGKLIIDRDPAFEFVTYDTDTAFKAYNG